MAVPFSNTKLRVPHGFEGLLEGLVREILLMQPNDIYGFAAVYFENLLGMREDGSDDPTEQVLKFKDRLYNNKAFQKRDARQDSEVPVQAAVAIQTKYRQYQAKSTVDERRREIAAIKIQSTIRGFLARQRVKKRRAEAKSRNVERSDLTDDADADNDIDKELQDLMDDDEDLMVSNLFSSATPNHSRAVDVTKRVLPASSEEASILPALKENAAVPTAPNKAVTVPDSSNEEASVRSAPSEEPTFPSAPQKEVTVPSAPNEEVVDIDLNDPEVKKAAVFIQSGFKGFKAKKFAAAKATKPVVETTDDKNELIVTNPDALKGVAVIQASFGSAMARLAGDVQNPMGNKEDNEAVVDEKLLPDEVETEHASSVLDILRDAEGHAVTVDGQNNIKPSDGGSEEREDRNEEMVAQAATKIQASFRGMKVRRRFTNTKIDGFTTDDVVETILDGHVDANE